MRDCKQRSQGKDASGNRENAGKSLHAAVSERHARAYGAKYDAKKDYACRDHQKTNVRFRNPAAAQDETKVAGQGFI